MELVAETEPSHHDGWKEGVEGESQANVPLKGENRANEKLVIKRRNGLLKKRGVFMGFMVICFLF